MSLQNGVVSVTSYVSVRIRIGATIPDPSLRIIILYNYKYMYLSDSPFSTCPLALNWPTHGTPVGKCLALRTHNNCLIPRPKCPTRFARRNQVVLPVGVATAPVPQLSFSPIVPVLPLCSPPVLIVVFRLRALFYHRYHYQ